MAPGLFRSLSSKFRSKDKPQSANGAAPTKNGAAPLTKVDEGKATPTTKADDSAGKPPAKLVNGTQANGTSAKPDQQANTASEYAAPKSTAVNGVSSSQHNNYDESSPPPKREDVESTFAEFASLIHASRRPLPTQMGDGSYLEKDEPTGFWDDMKHLGVSDLKAVTHIIEDQRSGKPSDDKKMHMEEVMQLVSHLPTNSANRRELTSLFLDGLWKSLQHPPQSYMSDEWKYRSADGRNNSYIFPELGKAKTPYARSVNPVTVQPGAPPDPFLIFDSVLAREEFKPHPNKVSSIFFNWASLVIHDLFQTDHVDPSISNTSSYLDLSILYGDTQEDQDQMRTFKDGKIKADCFAEERLLAFPPSCGVMLIMLNRFHNYVVEQLVLVNEAGRFDKPVESKRLHGEALAAAWKKWDNDLFQTGRLVTCGLYINITLYDYLRTIVNLNRTNSTWTLDPRIDNRKLANDGTPRGTGNQVSAEFSLSYRWHSCIGETDEKWTEAVYKELFEGKSSSEVDMEGLMCGLAKYDHDLPKDPQLRPFAHLKRGADGKFDDGDLAHIMQGGIEQVAGAFGARNIPKALRAVTALGILQCRSWNLCTLNEYRKFFALKPYDTFEEVNSDPYVADQLRHLYDHPDFIELYPGLAIEEYKDPMIPGVGICPTYTISRVVLSDAVSLVRGDRFYTIDYSPKHLTNWGFNEVAYDLGVNQGCVFYKLMLRALPNHFKENSIYAHYPMTIPSENAKIMKKLGRYDDYDWNQPAFIPERVFLESYDSAKKLCGDTKKFTVMWNDGLGFVMGKGGEKFCLGGDNTFHRKQREIMDKLIYRDKWHEHVKHFYEYITLRLLHENSHKIANTTQVDITRDVANLAHVHFASEMFDLPLKTQENPHGIFSEQEMWMAMCVIFTAIFFDFEPTKSFPLRMVARKLANMLGKLIELNVKSVSRTSMVSKLVDGHRENHSALADYGVHMIRRLTETGMSTYDMAFSQIMPTAVAMVPNQSQVITQVLDYYLNAGKQHWPEIARLSKIDSKESDELLLRYVNEGIRLNGTFGSYRRAEVADVFQEKQGEVVVKPGDKIFCSFVGAAHQADIFPQPYEVRLDRPMDSYIHYGIGEHTCLGKEASMVGLTAMLRTFGKLRNLRPVNGPQGKLKKVQREHGFYIYMREDHGTYFPWPCSFKVNYDGELPPLPAAKTEH